MPTNDLIETGTHRDQRRANPVGTPSGQVYLERGEIQEHCGFGLVTHTGYRVFGESGETLEVRNDRDELINGTFIPKTTPVILCSRADYEAAKSEQF
jgi:hypothetical protein